MLISRCCTVATSSTSSRSALRDAHPWSPKSAFGSQPTSRRVASPSSRPCPRAKSQRSSRHAAPSRAATAAVRRRRLSCVPRLRGRARCGTRRRTAGSRPASPRSHQPSSTIATIPSAPWRSPSRHPSTTPRSVRRWPNTPGRPRPRSRARRDPADPARADGCSRCCPAGEHPAGPHASPISFSYITQPSTGAIPARS
jgi:hypothetical protein